MKLELMVEGSTVQQKVTLTPLHQWQSRVGFHTPFPLDAYAPSRMKGLRLPVRPHSLTCSDQGHSFCRGWSFPFSFLGHLMLPILYMYFKSLFPAPLLWAEYFSALAAPPQWLLFLHKLSGGAGGA